MSLSIILAGGSKNEICGNGFRGIGINKNYSLFESDNEDKNDDGEFNGEFDININDNDSNDTDNEKDYRNINRKDNNSFKKIELINDCYYFNNSIECKYIFKIKPTNQVWVLNEYIKQKNDYLYKTSRNFPKLGGASTNIFYINTNDISYFLHYYYMFAILDTLNNNNNQLSQYLCSVIYSLYEFIKINNEAFVLNKKIKLFLNLFTKV
jgi:hypothetical protein